jgi:hypothetical protein
MSAILPHREITPQRPDSLADETVSGEPVSEAKFPANREKNTYATLLEALNRHRGKGQQKVTVEHVHVHSGGRAVVGVVGASGGGDDSKSEEQPRAKQIAHALEPARTRAGTPCQSPAMTNGRCRMHGGKAPGAPEGKPTGPSIPHPCASQQGWRLPHAVSQAVLISRRPPVERPLSPRPKKLTRRRGSRSSDQRERRAVLCAH